MKTDCDRDVEALLGMLSRVEDENDKLRHERDHLLAQVLTLRSMLGEEDYDYETYTADRC